MSKKKDRYNDFFEDHRYDDDDRDEEIIDDEEDYEDYEDEESDDEEEEDDSDDEEYEEDEEEEYDEEDEDLEEEEEEEEIEAEDEEEEVAAETSEKNPSPSSSGGGKFGYSLGNMLHAAKVSPTPQATPSNATSRKEPQGNAGSGGYGFKKAVVTPTRSETDSQASKPSETVKEKMSANAGKPGSDASPKSTKKADEAIDFAEVSDDWDEDPYRKKSTNPFSRLAFWKRRKKDSPYWDDETDSDDAHEEPSDDETIDSEDVTGKKGRLKRITRKLTRPVAAPAKKVRKLFTRLGKEESLDEFKAEVEKTVTGKSRKKSKRRGKSGGSTPNETNSPETLKRDWKGILKKTGIIAAAATVLLGIGQVSYLYYSNPDPDNPDAEKEESTLAKIASGAAEKIDAVVDSAKENLNALTQSDGTGETPDGEEDSLFTKLGDQVEDGFSTLEEKGQELKDKVSEKSQDFVDSVSDALSETKDKISDSIADASDKLSDSLSDEGLSFDFSDDKTAANESANAEDSLDTLAFHNSSTNDDQGVTTKTMRGESPTSNDSNALEEFGKDLQDQWNDGVAKTKEGMEQLKDKTEETVTTLADNIKQGSTEATRSVQDQWNAGVAKTDAALQDGANAVGQKMDEIGTKGKEFFQEVKEQGSELVEKTQDQLSSLATQTGEKIDQTVQNIQSSFDNLSQPQNQPTAGNSLGSSTRMTPLQVEANGSNSGTGSTLAPLATTGTSSLGTNPAGQGGSSLGSVSNRGGSSSLGSSSLTTPNSGNNPASTGTVATTPVTPQATGGTGNLASTGGNAAGTSPTTSPTTDAGAPLATVNAPALSGTSPAGGNGTGGEIAQAVQASSSTPNDEQTNFTSSFSPFGGYSAPGETISPTASTTTANNTPNVTAQSERALVSQAPGELNLATGQTSPTPITAGPMTTPATNPTPQQATGVGAGTPATTGTPAGMGNNVITGNNAVTGSNVATGTGVGNVGATEYREYQTKAGDNLLTIAENELGDSTRWTEISQLNQDKNLRGRLDEGIIILLPTSGN